MRDALPTQVPVTPVTAGAASGPVITEDQLAGALTKVQGVLADFDRYAVAGNGSRGLTLVRFPSVAHFSFPNGHGVIVEREDNGRFCVLPLEFGAYGRLETLSLSAVNNIASAGFPNPRQMGSLDIEKASRMVLLVSSLETSSTSTPGEPLEDDRRWHRLNPLELLA